MKYIPLIIALALLIVSCSDNRNETRKAIKQPSESDYKKELEDYRIKNKIKLNALVNRVDTMLYILENTAEINVDTIATKKIELFIPPGNFKRNTYISRYEDLARPEYAKRFNITVSSDRLNDMYTFSKYGLDSVSKLRSNFSYQILQSVLIESFEYDEKMKYTIIVVAMKFKLPTINEALGSYNSYKVGISYETAFVFDSQSAKLIDKINFVCQSNENIQYEEKENSRGEIVNNLKSRVERNFENVLGKGLAKALQRHFNSEDSTFHSYHFKY
jgi:hypothetical protein